MLRGNTCAERRLPVRLAKGGCKGRAGSPGNACLRPHGSFTFSAFTRLEISRGFKEKSATGQLTRFREFRRHPVITPVTDSGDADLIIASPPSKRAGTSSRVTPLTMPRSPDWH
jgi:hypothetical protein